MAATEPIIYPQVISVPYTYTAGRTQAAFLRGLAERRILGSRAGDRVLVPARPFAPDGSRTGDLVEVGTAGTLQAWTTSHHDGGTTTFGLIRLDGADTELLHVLDVPEDRLAKGLRVRARWADEPTTEITAIESFEVEAS
jgi:uncharacterized OB-fold protein